MAGRGGESVFVVRKEKNQKEVEEVDWKKNGGRAGEEKKDGWGGKGRSPLQCCTALIYVYS